MKSSVFLVFVAFSLLSNAQEGPKVVVFNSTETKEPEYWSKYNLVKFNVLEAFSGDFAFYYERILNKNFSVEGGLGVTLSDYFSGLINDNFDFTDETYEPLMGVSFSIGGRYYPFRAADEFYFAPEFKFKYYHNNQYYTNLMGMEEVAHESRTIPTGRVSFGYVYFFDSNIFIDYSAGFGIAKVTTRTLEQEYDNITGQFDFVIDETSRLVPRFHLGLKIGVAF